MKPAWEVILVFRKPLCGTVAATVQAHGTGALNIDASRIGTAADMNPRDFDDSRRSAPKFTGILNGGKEGQYRASSGAIPNGRFPANLILGCCDAPEPCEACPVAMLDAQSGVSTSVPRTPSPFHHTGTVTTFQRGSETSSYKDQGGASRFFFVAKASRAERDKYLDDLPRQSAGEATNRTDGSAGLDSPRAGAGRTGGARNQHPTVKPTALLRYLVKLVTPPGGVVLDPFAGSGTTGVAARLEGFGFIGIDQDADYCQTAVRRMAREVML